MEIRRKSTNRRSANHFPHWFLIKTHEFSYSFNTEYSYKSKPCTFTKNNAQCIQQQMSSIPSVFSVSKSCCFIAVPPLIHINSGSHCYVTLYNKFTEKSYKCSSCWNGQRDCKVQWAVTNMKACEPIWMCWYIKKLY